MCSVRLAAAMFAVLLFAFLAGCDASHSEPSDEPFVIEQASLTTAVRVRVSPVVETRIDRAGTVTGLVSAFRKTTVAAEVGGRVIKRLIEPGATVEKGQLLIELDHQRAQLGVAQAQAIANARAVDRPIPEAPPVTRATRSCSCPAILLGLRFGSVKSFVSTPSD